MNLSKFLIISLANKNAYNRWFKYEHWKCPLEHTLATVQFKCAHKFTYLSPFTHPKLHWSHFNKSKVLKFSKTFETGLSDQHKLISTTMKSGKFKGPPKKRRFRDVVQTLTLQIIATL